VVLNYITIKIEGRFLVLKTKTGKKKEREEPKWKINMRPGIDYEKLQKTQATRMIISYHEVLQLPASPFSFDLYFSSIVKTGEPLTWDLSQPPPCLSQSP
jgi:hypothetical protein